MPCTKHPPAPPKRRRINIWPKPKPVHPFSRQGGFTNNMTDVQAKTNPYPPCCWGAALEGGTPYHPPGPSQQLDSHLQNALCCLVPMHPSKTPRPAPFSSPFRLHVAGHGPTAPQQPARWDGQLGDDALAGWEVTGGSRGVSGDSLNPAAPKYCGQREPRGPPGARTSHPRAHSAS